MLKWGSQRAEWEPALLSPPLWDSFLFKRLLALHLQDFLYGFSW